MLLEVVSPYSRRPFRAGWRCFIWRGGSSRRSEIRASQPDLSNRVHLGFQTDIPALMKCMDIIARTSTPPETLGLVIVEGMLAGKPVIATRAGGAMEIIEDKQSGLLVEPGSVDDLQQRDSVCLADPDAANRIATAGDKRAR